MRSAAVCWEFAAGFAVSWGGDCLSTVFGLAPVVEVADAAGNKVPLGTVLSVASLCESVSFGAERFLATFGDSGDTSFCQRVCIGHYLK